jgi:Fur family ferric uptake transcriptional regulator
MQLNCKIRHNRRIIAAIAKMKAKQEHNFARGEEAAVTATMTATAEAQLQQASVRATDARIRVLATLLTAQCALSHQDMQEALADIDRVTLYRALDCLTDAGLAHKIAGSDRVFRYSAGAEHNRREEHAHGTHQHGHFQCTRCARVFCLDTDNSDSKITTHRNMATSSLRQELENLLHGALGKGFESHDIALTIKGWCADCAT